MIAYNTKWLNNLLIRDEADRALHLQCISKEEHEKISAAYHAGFYTPNIFVRIGLFILTVVIALFTLGLFLLVFLSGSDKEIGAILIFVGVAAYVGLEIIVAKKHYKSGVDDALLWIAPSGIITGFYVISPIPYLEYAIIVLVMSVFLFIRFTNMLMAGIAATALIAVIFLSFIKLGDIVKATTPFVVMICSALIYILANRLVNNQKFKLYKNGLVLITIIALTGFYIAGNYLVVRETSNELFNLNLQEGQTIPLGWLFWIFTFIIPFIYIARGLQKKDVILLRMGLVFIAAIVFTVRVYYHIMPLETAAVTGGILLIGIAYALIKYLHEPKFGFTYKKDDDPLFADKLQIESLIIAETFAATQQPTDKGFQFGGGSGGGAGASGEF